MKTKFNVKHFLTGEEITATELLNLIEQAIVLKQERKNHIENQKLHNKHLALLFDKPSLRTRFSFTIGMRELGGDVIESIADTRKFEEPEDQIGVLNGFCHAVMVRTHQDSYLERMISKAKISVINGLSDLHHPCQTLADLMTLKENFGHLTNLTLTYIGDGNNILHSLLLLAPPVGVNIHYCCPKGREPDSEIVSRANAKLNSNTGTIQSFVNPIDAVKNANVVYTDVWTSMGFEDSKAEHLFAGFQVNEELLKHAKSNCIFMHCLPMERDKEVSSSLADSACSVIFQQSENRLHTQKALLLYLLVN
jgi:ornithine carbamoyltransferase